MMTLLILAALLLVVGLTGISRRGCARLAQGHIARGDDAQMAHLKIPARRPTPAGTFDRIEEHLRNRLCMHKRAEAMNNIHARAGPCRHLSCRDFSLFSGVYRAPETGRGEALSRFSNYTGTLDLRRTPFPRFAGIAFLAGMHT
jgi:hypothetical protein